MLNGAGVIRIEQDLIWDADIAGSSLACSASISAPIPKHLNFFLIDLNRIVLLISFSGCSLLVWRNVTNSVCFVYHNFTE